MRLPGTGFRTAQVPGFLPMMRRCIDLAGRFAVALASAEREEALYKQAHYDELTGLPNRQLLKDRLEQQVMQARRDEKTGALLYLDLDRFKEINDIHGHSVGDVVLTQAAERITSEIRDSDTVSRLGGDEFVVVMPGTDLDGAVNIAEALCNSIRTLSLPHELPPWLHYQLHLSDKHRLVLLIEFQLLIR